MDIITGRAPPCGWWRWCRKEREKWSQNNVEVAVPSMPSLAIALLFMLPPVAAVAERALTMRALVRLVASVDPLVPVQVARAREDVPAKKKGDKAMIVEGDEGDGGDVGEEWE